MGSSDKSRRRSASKDRDRKRYDSDNESSKSKKTLEEAVTKVNISSFLEEEQKNKPTLEQLEDIDDTNFVQQSFTSTSDAFKKKKKRPTNNNALAEPVDNGHIQVSHDSAIFGTANDTMHVTKFQKQIIPIKDEDAGEEMVVSAVVDEDIFGPIFDEDPNMKMKRWIEKLKGLREGILSGLVKEEDSE